MMVREQYCACANCIGRSGGGGRGGGGRGGGGSGRGGGGRSWKQWGDDFWSRVQMVVKSARAAIILALCLGISYLWQPVVALMSLVVSAGLRGWVEGGRRSQLRNGGCSDQHRLARAPTDIQLCALPTRPASVLFAVELQLQHALRLNPVHPRDRGTPAEGERSWKIARRTRSFVGLADPACDAEPLWERRSMRVSWSACNICGWDLPAVFHDSVSSVCGSDGRLPNVLLRDCRRPSAESRGMTVGASVAGAVCCARPAMDSYSAQLAQRALFCCWRVARWHRFPGIDGSSARNVVGAVLERGGQELHSACMSHGLVQRTPHAIVICTSALAIRRVRVVHQASWVPRDVITHPLFRPAELPSML